ncbi:restriction endonuclease PLD domain-containing protein [Oceanobacillus iheyensis]|uniref:restriction endonuclease PLD domain-containing protein n=1 Tax=Oceanobacillus iheyensis TaxID=182710 RepID=UPI001260215B|nr:restriction endonuclease PLD domain-containing protein [Oceanobacillus iheyensis]
MIILYSPWREFSASDKEEYIKYLKIFGALSGLFKDSKEGKNASKPYLYYRNHEQLFAKVFDVEDLTRKDSAFDAVAKIEDQRIGVGLKTWIHSRDLTYQKVAEFNKVAPLELAPLIENKEYSNLIYKIAELRNERIKLDQRQYNTAFDIYHNITRDDNVMNIMETSYDLVQLDSLKMIDQNGRTYTFSDGLNRYKFYASKSVLLKEFDASKEKIYESIPIIQKDDPFEILNLIKLNNFDSKENVQNSIYLPIYSDRNMKVEDKSGFNAWNAAPKSKGSLTPRPEFEAYIPIPKWIHHTFPNFFGFNALNKIERNNSKSFNLHLPDGRKIKAIVTQDFGKSLQTNPQSVLGKWILHDVLGLKSRELLTMDHLVKLGVDSLKITKIDNQNFKIELAETYAFEQWKIDFEDEIKSSNSRSPKMRPFLMVE